MNSTFQGVCYKRNGVFLLVLTRTEHIHSNKRGKYLGTDTGRVIEMQWWQLSKAIFSLFLLSHCKQRANKRRYEIRRQK